MANNVVFKYHKPDLESLTLTLTDKEGTVVNGSPADALVQIGETTRYRAAVGESLIGWHCADVLNGSRRIWQGRVLLTNDGEDCLIDDPESISAEANALLESINDAFADNSSPEISRQWQPVHGLSDEVLEKQPAESLVFSFDFSRWLLLMGASLQSVDSVTSSPADESLVISEAALSGTKKKATARIAGGVNGTLYKVTATCTTTGGDTIEADGKLYVRNS